MSTGIVNSSTAFLAAKNPTVSTKLTSAWRVIYGPAGADEFAGGIEDPYELNEFLSNHGDVDEPLGREHRNSGGRIFLTGINTGEIQLLPLFTEDGATASFQLFAFDFAYKQAQDLDDASNKNPEGLISPYDDAGNLCLGIPLNLVHGTSTNNPLASFSQSNNDLVETVRITIDNNKVPYPDPEGDSFVVGFIKSFDLKGFFAVMPWVSAVSSGELVILARVV